MLSLALYTANPDSEFCIEQLVQESSQFNLVTKGTPDSPAADLFQSLKRHDPDVVLLDLTEWDSEGNDPGGAAALMRALKVSDLRAVVIGFLASWSAPQQAEFRGAGIADLLPLPFSSLELEKLVYDALHRDQPVTNQNILAFLPAKAGGGCSVIAINTAAALANQLHKKVLLLEADRRSGPLAIMLNLERHRGLPQALSSAASMTALAWQQQYVEVFGVHVLLAEPGRRDALPGWADYYQLLHFVQTRYDFVFADLPEVVNPASAEVVRCARGVFLVCTPEVPSLRMTIQRLAELEEYGVPAERVHIVLNRQERRGLPVQEIEAVLGHSIFAALPNDYAHIRDAIVESRLVASDSPFGEGCQALARKVSGLKEPSLMDSTFGLLTKLRRRAG
jgi:MinD-like ATPase involved in chromosome partitioning or flagellar assembly